MGIKNFAKLFQPSSVVKLKELKDVRIAVDAMCEIHRAMKGMIMSKSLKSGEHFTLHISVILQNIIKFEKAGIHQIWVFDSPEKNKNKSRELERRSKTREKAKEKIKKEQDDSKISTLEKTGFSIPAYAIEDVKKILLLTGTPFIEAPQGYEAEHICARLAQEDQVDYVLSSDMDTLVFGAPCVLKRDKTNFVLFVLDDILEEHNLNYDKFIEVCVHLGTDFADKTPGVGPKTILKKMPMPFSAEQKKAIEIFKDRPDIPDPIEGEPDKKELLDWLVNKKEFSCDKWKKTLGL